jgi:hypothetical protein
VIESISRGVLDTPLQLVIGLAEGETRWRGTTTASWSIGLCPVIARSVSDDLSAVAQQAKAEAIHFSVTRLDGLLRFRAQ